MDETLGRFATELHDLIGKYLGDDAIRKLPNSEQVEYVQRIHSIIKSKGNLLLKMGIEIYQKKQEINHDVRRNQSKDVVV